MKELREWLGAFAPGHIVDFAENGRYTSALSEVLQAIFLLACLPVMLIGPALALVWTVVAIAFMWPWVLFCRWRWRVNSERMRVAKTLAPYMHAEFDPKTPWESLRDTDRTKWVLLARKTLAKVDCKGPTNMYARDL